MITVFNEIIAHPDKNFSNVPLLTTTFKQKHYTFNYPQKKLAVWQNSIANQANLILE